MRITGGEYSGLRIDVPDTGVRPAKDRVRISLFSSLAPVLADSLVLDIFAGSGALGLEALSRGAAEVWFIEQDRKAAAVLKSNMDRILKTDIARAHLVQCDVFSFKCPASLKFDFVFADPPYDYTPGNPLLLNTLRLLEKKAMLKPGALLIFEQHESMASVEEPGWELVRNKPYGQTVLLWYKWSGPVGSKARAGES